MKRKEFFSLALRSFLLIALATTGACSSVGKPAAETGTRSATESTAPPAAYQFVGKVAETMNAGSYTYALLEREDEQVWVAGPETPLTVGDEVAVALTARMENFESPTLQRTFESIYFVASLGSELPTGGGAASGNPHAGMPGLKAPTETQKIDVGSIEKAKGGYRVADLFGQRKDLVGKEVVVRGRVVKSNSGIMGHTWLHIRDGSGDPEKGTHDLTVTTQGSATVGDVITVRGVVAIDKDFGAGYSYELIVEEASVKVD